MEDFKHASRTRCGSLTPALWAKGLLPGGKLTLNNRGGTLQVAVSGGERIDSLLLEGPTQIVKVYDLQI